RYWDKYYQERSQQVLRDLQNGDKELEQFNRPMEVELSILRHDWFQQAGAPDPAAAKEAAIDIRPALERLLDQHGLGDLLGRDDTPSGRWIKVRARLDNPLPFFAKSKVYEPLVGRRPTLATLRVEEAFMVYFKVCIVTGFVLASPWIFYQLWSFVAAGLYPHEKRYVNVFLPFSLGLFLVGVGVCEFLVIPKAVEALLWFNEWLGLEPDLRLNEWLGFAIWMPV